MSKEQEKPNDDSPRLNQVPAEDVPVFSCLIYVSSVKTAGQVSVRSATLKDISCEGANERAALQRIVAVLKEYFAEQVASGKAIPWLDSPLEKMPEEVERWIAVHL